MPASLSAITSKWTATLAAPTPPRLQKNYLKYRLFPKLHTPVHGERCLTHSRHSGNIRKGEVQEVQSLTLRRQGQHPRKSSSFLPLVLCMHVTVDLTQGHFPTELYPQPFCKFYFETVSSHKVAEAGLKLAILLARPPETLGLQACAIVPDTAFFEVYQIKMCTLRCALWHLIHIFYQSIFQVYTTLTITINHLQNLQLKVCIGQISLFPVPCPW